MKKETTTLKILGRADLIKRQELKIELVDLGNGQGVYVKELTALEKNEYEASLLEKKNDGKGGFKYEGSLKNVLAKLLVWTACDAKGKLIFLPNEAATLSQNMKSSQMDLIVNKAKELNKLTDKHMEDLAKNSEQDREDNSNSGSVSN